MKRRTVLTLAVGAGLSAAGCLGPSDTPTETEPPLVRAGPGDYPHDIYVRNALDRDVTLTLAVDQLGTEIYRREHTVAADTGAVVAGITRETLPEGERELAVTATLPSGQSSRVEVAVTDCLGSVDFSIDTDGGLQSTYSIC